MKFTHALATGAATFTTITAGVLVGATPAEAAPKTRSLPCTYVVDEAAGTISGECHGSTPLGTADATFSGTWADGSATGTFTLDTWLWDSSGSFSGTGFDGDRATGTYTVMTPFGTYSGTFSAAAG
jgi:hypothetical protein